MAKYITKRNKIIAVVVGVLLMGLIGYGTYNNVHKDYKQLEKGYMELVNHKDKIEQATDLDTLNKTFEVYQSEMIEYKVALMETDEYTIYNIFFKDKTKALKDKTDKLKKEVEELYIKKGVEIVKNSAIQTIQNGFKTFYTILKTLVTDVELQELVGELVPDGMQTYFK